MDFPFMAGHFNEFLELYLLSFPLRRTPNSAAFGAKNHTLVDT